MVKLAGYKFSDKSHSLKGIFSTVFGVISFLMLLALIWVSAKAKGQGSIYIGSIGLTALIVNIIGLVMGLLGFLESDRYKLFARIGSVWNLLILVGWVSIIMIGA